MACETRRPRHQSQLNRALAGQFGSVNCTASAAAIVAEAVLCGPDRVIAAKEIRAKSDEPVPADPPGLTLGQVTAALDKITRNAVQLTIKQPISWEHLEARLRRGQVAVLQVNRQELLAQGGESFGQMFLGPHAVAIGFDRDELWVDDPLGRRRYVVPDRDFTVIGKAAAALKLEGGGTVGTHFGARHAYAAFGRRPHTRPARSRVKIKKGAIIKRYRMKGDAFFEVQAITTPMAVEAVCTEPKRSYAHPNGPAFGSRPRNLAVVLTGPAFLKGYAVRDGDRDVRIDELDADDAMPPVDADGAAFDVDDVTSPDLLDDPALFEVSDADLAELEAADIDVPGVKNGDVGEPLLPDDFEEEDEDDDLIRRDGS
jgi:hypothetical protein